jgi:hypothetical protein
MDWVAFLVGLQGGFFAASVVVLFAARVWARRAERDAALCNERIGQIREFAALWNYGAHAEASELLNAAQGAGRQKGKR